MTRQEVKAAILACKEKMGYVPTIPELMKHQGIDRTVVRRYFGNYQCALEECNLEVPERGKTVAIDRVFRDWAEVVRDLKKLPSVFEYEKRGKYSSRPLTRCFGPWKQAPEAMKLYAEDHGLAEEWKEVLELVEQQAGGQAREQAGGQGGGAMMFAGLSKMADRPMYGPLIRSSAFVYGPTNESGVVCLFGAMAEPLGFLILRIQAEFPDCEAMRVVAGDRLQPVRIEFEYESRNFQKHMHDPAGCDLIVCWAHNWPECPLEVVELRKEVSKNRRKTLPLMNTDDTD